MLDYLSLTLCHIFFFAPFELSSSCFSLGLLALQSRQTVCPHKERERENEREMLVITEDIHALLSTPVIV